MKPRRIAVLGAGIMGCSTAILLARRGYQVVLFDSGNAPFCGASRWNEGKIHLGFLYSADPSLETARKLIPGGLSFKPLVEDLLSCSIAPATTDASDLFLSHRDSVVPADQMLGYLRKVLQLARTHPAAGQYLTDLNDAELARLSARQLANVANPCVITAGIKVPERSVSTTWLADRFCDAVSSELRIEQRLKTTVKSVAESVAGTWRGPWFIRTDQGEKGPFDLVVNALWEGRVAVDLTAGVSPARPWSNRYRVAAFVRTDIPVDQPSAIVTTGPFGDIKNYDGKTFYASWYPVGLLVDSQAVSPEPPGSLSSEGQLALAEKILGKLATCLPGVPRLLERAKSIRVNGGWVHASGTGVLSDPQSTLHMRSRFGVFRSGSYISVDTGKYSTAPWLARQVVDSIEIAR